MMRVTQKEVERRCAGEYGWFRSKEADYKKELSENHWQINVTEFYKDTGELVFRLWLRVAALKRIGEESKIGWYVSDIDSFRTHYPHYKKSVYGKKGGKFEGYMNLTYDSLINNISYETMGGGQIVDGKVYKDKIAQTEYEILKETGIDYQLGNKKVPLREGNRSAWEWL